MRRLSVLFIVFLIALPLSGVIAQGSADTIVIRTLGNVTNFNPVLTTDGGSLQAYNLLWPAPFKTDVMTSEWTPGLTSWTISEDNLTYTFKIRDDAVWSDGTPITAADMKFVIDAVQSDVVQSVLEPNASLITAVNIIDDKTYEIVLSEVNCAALGNFSTFRFLPSHRFAPDFSDFETNTITTNPDISGGPYILDEWVPDEFQRFHANPTYFEGEARIPFLVNRILQDPTLMITALQAGEIDYANMQGDTFEQIGNKDDLNYQAFPAISVGFVSLNWADPTNPQAAYDADGNLVEQTPHPLFSDPRIRQAVAMGYNKDDIIASLGENGGTRLLSFVVPGLAWAYNTDIEPWPYDPEAAAALLDEAGWVDSDGDGIRDKDGQKLAFTVTYSDLVKYFDTTALIMQDQLGQLGFEVTLDKMEWATYLEEAYFGQKYDATPISNSRPTAPDPNDFTSLLLSRQDVPGGGGNNIASYVNPEVDALIEQGRTVAGCAPEDRAPIYKQLQEIIRNDVAYDFTLTPNFYQIANKRVGNFRPGATWAFYGYLDQVHEWTLEG